METMAEIEPTLAGVRQYFRERKPYGYTSRSTLEVKPYGSGPDTRIGWDSVYIVLVNGLPYGFTDGPIKEE
jgi:hypothetical protein